MLPLIERCISGNDPDAWGDLWEIVDEVALSSARRILTQCHFSSTIAADLASDILVYLYEDQQRRLRTFQGTTDGEFRAWLRHVSVNFTWNWIDAQFRRIRNEREALAEMPTVPRDGLTEEQINAQLAEWRSVFSPIDFHRLQLLFGMESPSTHIPERTRRRWMRDLLTKYEQYF